MTYLGININYLTLLNDIYSRKEFKFLPLQSQKEYDYELKGFNLSSAQLFIKNFINPNTPYTRILLNWMTGSGKTAPSLAIAIEFIKVFKKLKQYDKSINRIVSYLGFTQDIFQRELIFNSEFGFVSEDEITELKKLEYNCNNSIEDNVKYLIKIATYKRRLTDFNKGGYFKFYGNKELSNKLFIITDKGLKAKYTVNGVDSMDDIDKAIEDGLVLINDELLKSFSDGLMICDEIHNLYNINETNRYGLAIQYILKSLKDRAPRLILLSATPITGSASEIVDLLNLLNDTNLKRSDLFQTTSKPDTMVSFNAGIAQSADDIFILDDTDNIDYSNTNRPLIVSIKPDESSYEVNESVYQTKVSKLKPGALEKIKELSRGKVSYLIDTDVNLYPERIFYGESIPEIPYLKFILCPISKFHLDTCLYENKIKSKNMTYNFSISSYSLFDIAFPNPDGKIGLYNSMTIIDDINNATQQWKDDNKISIEHDSGMKYMTGEFLKLENIGYYSSKYETMIKELLKDCCNDSGKAIIYHNRIRISGVLLIQEILKQNGIISKNGMVKSNTICAKCGQVSSKHKDHDFIPARFLIVHSDLDSGDRNAEIRRFNNIDNINGYKYKYFIGSKVIKESYNFFCVRNMYIMSAPNDYPTLVQLIGRAIRKRAHLDLPPEKRKTIIKIFAVLNGTYSESPELLRYYNKGQEYLVIQSIEKVLRENSIDLLTNNITMTEDSIDGLKLSTNKITNSELKLTTFDAYKYNNSEINIIEKLFKLLFESKNCWLKTDIIKELKTKSFKNFYYNIKQFNDDNFLIAIDNLKRPFYIGPNLMSIIDIGKYLIQCKLTSDGRPIIDLNSYVRDCNTALNYTAARDIVIKFGTNVNILPELKINVNEYIDRSKRSIFISDNMKELNKIIDNKDATELLFINFNIHFHEYLLKSLIEKTLDQKLHSKLIKIYNSARILVKNNDIHKNGNSNLIGYICKNLIHIYDDEWTSIPLTNLINSVNSIENSICIGYMENETDLFSTAKFKIRPPIDKKIKDHRTVFRGILCEFKVNSELVAIVNKLRSNANHKGIIVPKLEVNMEKRTRNLCNTLKQLLVKLEIYEIANENKYKWFYLF